MVGRTPSTAKDEQLKKYKEKKDELLETDGTLKPRTAKVFEDLGSQLNMTGNAVHTSISRMMDEIFGTGNYSRSTMTKETKSQEATDFLYREAEGFTVVLTIPDRYRTNFDVIEEHTKKRTYKKLREGWSDVLFDIIVKQTATECILNFSKVSLSKGSGDVYEFDVTATCKECLGVMKISSSRNRTSISTVFTAGPNEHTHTKSRRITATRANLVYDELKSDTVLNVFHKQTESIPHDADHLPRNFMSYKSIENIKTNHIRSNSSALNELRRMKYSAEYENVIKEIATDPFVLIFWTKAQVHCYAQIAAGKGKACISLDATGSLISNNSLLADISDSLERDIRLPHIFLYLISVKNDDGKSIPVGQMLSAQQDSTRITYFFKRWLESFKKPAEVAIDDSKALLKSCAESFALCEDTKDYIRKCYAVLGGEQHALPKCYLRLDVAHFVKNLHKILILRKMGSIAKQFYLSCIGIIIQCEDYSVIRDIVKHMVILANGAPECGKSQRMLSELIQSHETEIISKFTSEENNDENESFPEESDIENEYPKDTAIDSGTSWFDDILNEVKEKIVGENDVIAPYFQPNLNNTFKKLFDRVVLWSAVMKPHFGSDYILPTSNDTESRFNVIKSVVFNNYTFPLKPDLFSKILIPYLESVAKLTSIANSQQVIRKIYVI